MTVEQRIQELGLKLPAPSAPAFEYLAVVVHRDTAWISGQIPRAGAQVLLTGKVGAEVSLDQARDAAQTCVLQGLSQLAQAIGTLDKVERIIKLTGFVASAPGFVQQPKVIDAASEVLIRIFGDAGRHARSAVGVAELPRGVPVEIELIAALRP